MVAIAAEPGRGITWSSTSPRPGKALAVLGEGEIVVSGLRKVADSGAGAGGIVGVVVEACAEVTEAAGLAEPLGNDFGSAGGFGFAMGCGWLVEERGLAAAGPGVVVVAGGAEAVELLAADSVLRCRIFGNAMMATRTTTAAIRGTT